MIHLVTAIIKPFRLGEVKDALKAAGAFGVTVTEVQGFGRQGGHSETFRGAEYTVDFVPKIKVEVLIDSNDVDAIVAAVVDAARTGLNPLETQLRWANVPTSFGKLFTVALDGAEVGQPIYESGVNITTGPLQGVQNVVFVATDGVRNAESPIICTQAIKVVGPTTAIIINKK